jgi:hypothetical protein
VCITPLARSKRVHPLLSPIGNIRRVCSLPMWPRGFRDVFSPAPSPLSSKLLHSPRPLLTLRSLLSPSTLHLRLYLLSPSQHLPTRYCLLPSAHICLGHLSSVSVSEGRTSITTWTVQHRHWLGVMISASLSTMVVRGLFLKLA